VHGQVHGRVSGWAGDARRTTPTLPVHRARNLLSKIPKNAQAEVKADYWAIFEVPEDLEPGLDAVDHVQTKIDDFTRRWRDSYPAAVRILTPDRESLTPYLRVPREHWSRVRHSTFIERTFGETRRRVKVIGRLPAATSCISLVWAVLDRCSRGARGFTIDPRRAPMAPRPAPHPARTTHRTTTRRPPPADEPDTVGVSTSAHLHRS